MTSKGAYLIVLFFITTLLFWNCDEIPQGSVVLSRAEYDSLRSGAIIKEVEIEVPIPPDYDSVNNFWNGKLTSEIFVREQTIISLTEQLSVRQDTIVIDTCLGNLNTDPSASLVRVEPYEVKVDTVITLSSGLLPENIIDGVPFVTRTNPGTRWAVSGYPHFIVFNFSKVVQLDSIYINTFAWNENYLHDFTVFNCGDSITAFTTKPVKYSGHALGIKTSQLVLEITGGKNNWTDIGEVYFVGSKGEE